MNIRSALTTCTVAAVVPAAHLRLMTANRDRIYEIVINANADLSAQPDGWETGSPHRAHRLSRLTERTGSETLWAPSNQ
jgi:hypothetical protein